MALNTALVRASTGSSQPVSPGGEAGGDPLALVDPELRPVVVEMQKQFGNMPSLSADNLAERR